MNSMSNVDAYRRVLLVDDDPIQLKLGRAYLRAAGFVVETALGPDEALQKAKRAKVDAVVCDVIMGDVDGFALCRQLRDRLGPELRRVILTSSHYGGEAAEQLAARAGASALVIKTPELRAEIEALRSSFDEAPPARSDSMDAAFHEEHLRTSTNQLADMAGKARIAEEKYRLLVERLPDAVWTADETGRVTYVSPSVEQICGYTPEEMCAESFEARCKNHVHPEDVGHVKRALIALFRENKPLDIEYRRRHKDGRWIWVRNRSFGTFERDGVRYAEGMLSDVTETRRLEESARQSQKMEAIGQLVGSIAHDFNNILAVILGNSHFLVDALIGRDPRRGDAEEVKRAAEKGAALTRQLLAFTRRQVLAPAVINLDTVVAGLEKMLRRLIGEDIDCSIFGDANIGSVRADPGQIEQVLMNLVINARDAMPTGGKLTIETANVDLDEAYSDRHAPSVPPGRYVMLAVTDDGCGMTEETKRHVFEPFFTTKEEGKGTGLGLSTCFGIVKQSGGYIWVYSELGKGTVFKVYLPRVDDQPASVRKSAPAGRLNGTETILLVEDDESVRTTVERILRDRGYRILVARDGDQAVRVTKSYDGPIHLVLTDVVLPGHSGPEVTNLLTVAREGADKPKALFMSGYTDRAILENGALEAGVNFVQKPFAPEILARKVREVLDA